MRRAQTLAARFEPRPDAVDARPHLLYRTAGQGAWLIREEQPDGSTVGVELCASFLVACAVAAERSRCHLAASPPGDPRRPLAMFDQEAPHG